MRREITLTTCDVSARDNKRSLLVSRRIPCNHRIPEFLGVNTIISLLLILLLGRTLRSSGYIISYDLSMPLFPKQFNAFYWPTWNEYQNAPVIYSLLQLSYPSTLLTYFLLGLFGGILSVDVALKLIVIIFPFFIGGNAFYYFVKKELLQKLHRLDSYSLFATAVCGMLIFLASPASLNLLVQTPIEFQTMSLLPLLLFLLKKSYATDSKIFIVGTALVLMMAATSHHSVVILMITLIIFLAFHITLKNVLKTLAITLLSILYSSFWIFPIIFSEPERSGFIVSRLILQGKDIIPVLTGLAWYASPFVYYPSSYTILWLLPPILAVVPLTVIKTKSIELRTVLSLTAMFILSISLIQGTKGIFGEFFVLISQSFGHFASLFRSTYHFYSLYVLSVASLSSLGLANLFVSAFQSLGLMLKITLTRVTKVTAISTIMTIIIIGAMPSFTGDLQGVYVSSNPPKAYEVVNHWLENQKGDFNVLWLPPGTRTTSWNSPRITNLYFVAASSSRPSFQWFTRNILYYVYYQIYHNHTLNIAKTLSILGIKYILYHNDVDQILGDSGAPQKVLQNLLHSHDLKLVLTVDPIYVFQNTKYDTTRITTVNNIIYQVGGLESINYLNSLEYFKPSSFAIFDVDSSYYYNKARHPSFSSGIKSTLVSFNNANIDDLILSKASDYVIDPSIYVNYGDNWRYWIPQDWFSFYYNFVLRHSSSFNPPPWITDGVLGPQTQSILVNYYSPSGDYYIPVTPRSPDNYLIFMRVFKGSPSGKLLVEIGNLKAILDLHTEVNQGFMWVKVGEAYLDGTKYDLHIKSIDGVNAFSLIGIIPVNLFNKSYSEISDQLSEISTVNILNYKGFHYLRSPLGFQLLKDDEASVKWALLHVSSEVNMTKIDARFNKSYIEIPYFNELNQTSYTISFWLRLYGKASFNYQPVFYIRGIADVFLDESNVLWITVPGLTAGYKLSQNALYNIVIVNDGQKLTYYINGEPLGGEWNAKPGNAIRSPILIGLNSTHENFAPYDISNIQVYKGVLSANEIETLYSFGPSSKPLNAHQYILWAPLNGSLTYYVNERKTNIPKYENVCLSLLRGDDEASAVFYAFRNGHYQFLVRARSPYSNGKIILTVDDYKISEVEINQTSFNFYPIGNLRLNYGWHRISMKIIGSIVLDALNIASPENTLSFSNVSSTIPLVTSPYPITKHFIVNATTPTVLVYRSWYDDGFLLNANGYTLHSYPSFLSTNAYLLGKNISSTITGSLIYKPQKLAEIGLSITLTSLSLTIITITFAIMKRVKRAA
jgi:hypothetical protein